MRADGRALVLLEGASSVLALKVAADVEASLLAGRRVAVLGSSPADWLVIAAFGASLAVKFSVFKNATQGSIPGSAFTLLTWTNERFDVGSAFANHRFTPTVPGTYLLVATAMWVAGVPNATRLILALFKNGARAQEQNIAASGSDYQSETVTAMVEANGVSDYFEIYVWHGAAAAQSIYGSAGGFETHWSGVRL